MTPVLGGLAGAWALTGTQLHSELLAKGLGPHGKVYERLFKQRLNATFKLSFATGFSVAK